MLGLQECLGLGTGMPASCTAGKEPDFVAESKPTEVSSLARKDLAADDIRATLSARKQVLSHLITQQCQSQAEA